MPGRIGHWTAFSIEFGPGFYNRYVNRYWLLLSKSGFAEILVMSTFTGYAIDYAIGYCGWF